MFSPGNLRATFDNPNYERLVNYWIGEKYTLRYTGGMVPDVFQIIVKEKGVFSNVTSPTSKAKLRVLFEVAPLGLLVCVKKGMVLMKPQHTFHNTLHNTHLTLHNTPSTKQVEKAGGASSADGKQISALDIPIEAYDQRTQICYGSVGEVRRFEEFMYGTSERFAKVAA